jgi:hypothetical protein
MLNSAALESHIKVVDGEGTKVKNTWQLVLIQNKYIRP